MFLDPWEDVAEDLRIYFDGVVRRRESRILAIYGPQGAGKTLFATKLTADFSAAKRDRGRIEPDRANLWHRISGGRGLAAELIADATRNADVLLAKNLNDWVDTTSHWLSPRDDRRCIVLADNAERPYFRRGLVPMSDDNYLRMANRPEFTEFAAQKLVELCRGDFQGSLLIVLSNNLEFLGALERAVQSQHEGLLKLTHLPLPDGPTKETVVRVNTNRLNEFSYWYCLDKASPEDKLAVKRALEGASSFPDSFQAVDNAIREATAIRLGRPARQNVLTLFVLTGFEDAAVVDPSALGEVTREDVVHGWCAAHVLERGWAPKEIGERAASMVESEWVLRVIVLGKPFVTSLVLIGSSTPRSGGLSGHTDACRGLLELFSTVHSPGTRKPTRDAFTANVRRLIDAWPTADVNLDPFWDIGQVRSRVYESGLTQILPSYNTRSGGFMRYRPDFVAAPYKPCSILASTNDTRQAINAAIRRSAHAFEFTANRQYSAATVKAYLTSKLPNYVEITREQ